MFYTSVFDPQLIVYQIIVLQCIYYIITSLLLLLSHLLFRTPVILAILLNSTYTHTHTYTTVIVAILTAPCISIALLLSVGRSKKCLDHVCTIHIIHILLCTTVYHIPTEYEWWITQILAGAISTLLGEYLCYQREIQSINLHDHDTRTPTSTGSKQANHVDDLEMQSMQPKMRVAKPLLVSVQ